MIGPYCLICFEKGWIMHVLLVNPHYPISETPSPPLGLAYLAACLEAAGVEVRILDFVVFPYSRQAVETVLKKFSPRVVGVTSVTMTFDNAARVIRDVKAIDAEVLTVMGGPHVTFCAEQTMRCLPELDAVVPGEGESAFLQLVDAVKTGGKWHAVPGVVYQDGRHIARAPGAVAPVNLDALPSPARHLLALGRYRALGMPVSMTTSRGCPYKCIFCVGRKMGGPVVRYRNAGKVVDEMAQLSALGFHQINIADDLFTADRRHCDTVCGEILGRRLRVDWTAFARVDTVTADLLSKMKAAGCHTISFGVESANENILKTIKKGITPAQVVSAVKACAAAGITPHASFILGLPGETPETLEETIRFGDRLKEMGVHHGFHILTPFPGTEVRERCGTYGIRIITDDWTRYHANRAVVETASVSRQMLDDVVVTWENRFNEWLGDIQKRTGTGEATPEEAWQLKRLEHTVLIYDLMMGRVLERKGRGPEGHPDSPAVDPIESLANRLEDAVTVSRQQLLETLSFAEKTGNLTRRNKNGEIHWEWVDFLFAQS